MVGEHPSRALGALLVWGRGVWVNRPMAAPLEPSAAEASAPSEAEFRAWMARYGPGLRRYFQRRADPAEADDLVQEVFLALRARSATSDIDNVEGYLFKTAVSVLARWSSAYVPSNTIVPPRVPACGPTSTM